VKKRKQRPIFSSLEKIVIPPVQEPDLKENPSGPEVSPEISLESGGLEGPPTQAPPPVRLPVQSAEKDQEWSPQRQEIQTGPVAEKLDALLPSQAMTPPPALSAETQEPASPEAQDYLGFQSDLAEAGEVEAEKFTPPGVIRLSAGSHDFGQVLSGEAARWELTVQNEGEGDLTVTAWGGLPAGGFELVQAPPVPLTIAPHESMTLTVQFAPDSLGKKAATLSIHLEQAPEAMPEVPLVGVGVVAIPGSAGYHYSPLTNSFGMEFVYIPAGSFLMGSPETEPGRNPDEVQHGVTITRAYYIQTTSVTQAQWQALMGVTPSRFKERDRDCPVIGVSWSDCQKFIQRLNARGEGTYRLPTEAQWEYACRAGTPTAFANGEIIKVFCEYDPNLDALGWYCGNAPQGPHPVAQKSPNAWGLYDMHGNVYEWCHDWYAEYPTTPQTDPQGPFTGSARVARGGSWFSSSKNCRSGARFKCPPHSSSNLQIMSFRLAREL
jgi:formylglycine-generating enzyme required for sulfatase activity